MTQPSLINLHPNEYIEGLHYYSFSINIDRFVGSCNALNDLFNKVCSKKTVFNVITGINELEILTKHIV